MNIEEEQMKAITAGQKLNRPLPESPFANLLGGTFTPQPSNRRSFGEWVYRIFRPCDHKWETLDSKQIYRSYNGSEIETGILYILKCGKCGDLKKRKITA